MRYTENFKRSQTKQIPTGFELQIDCKEVLNVTNENNERMKFQYDGRNQVLIILEKEFKLITVDYNS